MWIDASLCPNAKQSYTTPVWLGIGLSTSFSAAWGEFKGVQGMCRGASEMPVDWGSPSQGTPFEFGVYAAGISRAIVRMLHGIRHEDHSDW